MSFAQPHSRIATRARLQVVAKYQDLATRLGWYLLVLIACCSPWGDVLRLEQERGPAGRGLTTVFAIAVIIVSLLSTKLFRAMILRPRVLFFAAFVAIGTAASLLANVSLQTSLVNGLNRGGYWILMVAVLSFDLSSEKARTFVRLFSISTALMSLVSLLDYFGVAEITGFNEGYTQFGLEKGLIGRSLVGPFRIRSLLAAHLALAWPVPLMELVHGKLRNPLKIALWASVLIALTLAISVCYSRALYLTVALALVYAVYTTRSYKILRILLLVAPLLAAFFVVAQSTFPHEMAVLVDRLSSLSPDKIIQSGGGFRVEAFTTTARDLLHHPLGMGFGKVTIGTTEFVVHSVFVEHLRPAGLLGLLLVCLFMWPVFKTVIRRQAPAGTMVVSSSLLGILAYGTAHSSHSMLAAWIVIGFLYAMSKEPDRPNLSYGIPRSR